MTSSTEFPRFWDDSRWATRLPLLNVDVVFLFHHHMSPNALKKFKEQHGHCKIPGIIKTLAIGPSIREHNTSCARRIKSLKLFRRRWIGWLTLDSLRVISNHRTATNGFRAASCFEGRIWCCSLWLGSSSVNSLDSSMIYICTKYLESCLKREWGWLIGVPRMNGKHWIFFI